MERDVLINRLEYAIKGGYITDDEKIVLLRESLAAIRVRPKNQALALDELREMARLGKSTWCVDTDGTAQGLLCYVDCVFADGKDAHIWLLDIEGNAGRYNVRYMIEMGAKFYRDKPEEK